MKPTRVLGILMLAGLLTAGIGCPGSSTGGGNGNGGAPPNGNAPPMNNSNDNSVDLTGRAIEGLRFYSENGCAACHCNDGAGGCNLGAPNIQGASLVSIDANLRAPQPCLDVTDDGVDDCADVEDPESHPLKLFNAELQDIDDLSTYLQALDEDNPFPGEASQISRGFVLYMQAGCVACHLPSAQGTNQGGVGQAIAATDPDTVRGALTGGVSCHPLQIEGTELPEPGCSLTGDYIIAPLGGPVHMLVDGGPGAQDEELTQLAYFLAFIAPVPEIGVDPCLNRPGDICTVAGLGAGGYNTDGVAATESVLYFPQDIELTDWNDDGNLDLGIDDWNNHRIRIVYLDVCTPSPRDVNVCNQIISIAGTGKVTGTDALNHPTDLAFTPPGLGDPTLDGALVMANWHNQNMYRYPKSITSGEERHQVAGLCNLVCDDDGPVAIVDAMGNVTGGAFLALPSSLAINPSNGLIYFAEAGCSRIRILDPIGSARLLQPDGCIDPVNLYADATIATLAGRARMNGYVGDGGPASAALFNVFNGPTTVNMGVALSPENPPAELYIADSQNHVIRRINLLADPPMIELFAGQAPPEGPANSMMPNPGGFEDGDRLTAARFNFPANVHVDANRNVYVADARNHAVRRIDAGTGEVTTIAGVGRPGFNGDNAPATQAQLDTPYGIAVHPDGRVFISDTNNNRIRVIIPEGFTTDGKCTTAEGDQGVSVCVP